MNGYTTTLTRPRWPFVPAVALLACHVLAGTLSAQEANAAKAKRLPVLDVRREPHRAHTFLTFVRTTFPGVPGFTCESWCYESAVEFLGFRKLDGGALELRHRLRSQPHVLFLTTVTPLPGAVEFVARPAVDGEREPKGTLPAQLLGLRPLFPAPACRGLPQPTRLARDFPEAAKLKERRAGLAPRGFPFPFAPPGTAEPRIDRRVGG